MIKSLSQVNSTLHALNTICDIIDDTLGESDDPHIVAVKDLFDFVWLELQKTEEILHNILKQ